MERILVKIKKDSKRPLTDKYTFNKEKNVYEELSTFGMVLDVKDVSAYDDMRKRESVATQEAYIVSMGRSAYADKGGPECKVGDLVLICKYSGEDMHDIEDGVIYRAITDQDVIVVYDGEGLNHD